MRIRRPPYNLHDKAAPADSAQSRPDERARGRLAKWRPKSNINLKGAQNKQLPRQTMRPPPLYRWPASSLAGRPAGQLAASKACERAHYVSMPFEQPANLWARRTGQGGRWPARAPVHWHGPTDSGPRANKQTNKRTNGRWCGRGRARPSGAAATARALIMRALVCPRTRAHTGAQEPPAQPAHGLSHWPIKLGRHPKWPGGRLWRRWHKSERHSWARATVALISSCAFVSKLAHTWAGTGRQRAINP